jgi:hypothetical protein
VLVHQVEHAGDALGVAVGEKRVGRQVGQPSLDRFGQEPAGTRDGLAAGAAGASAGSVPINSEVKAVAAAVMPELDRLMLNKRH